MKKIFLVGVATFLLSGCSSNGEDVTCIIGGKESIFTLKNGIIINYKLDGQDISSSKIDEINGEYFTSASNNEEGKQALNRFVSSFNGRCE